MDGSGFVVLPGEAQAGVVQRTFLLNFFDAS
jgi:hypothetical protein